MVSKFLLRHDSMTTRLDASSKEDKGGSANASAPQRGFRNLFQVLVWNVLHS